MFGWLMRTIELAGREQYPIGFGTYRLSSLIARGDADRAAAVVRTAVESGVTLVDTAAAYGNGAVEVLLGTALEAFRSDVTVATKAGLNATPFGRWEPDGAPRSLRRSCEGSLRRLRVERLTIVQLHTVDPLVPFEESLGTLGELRDEGKIAHIGLSNVTPDEVARAARVTPIVSVQNCYNVADRHAEALIERCEKIGAVFLPWFPVARGLVTQHGTVRVIAARHGASPAQVALAWLLSRSDVVLPIPGSASEAHIVDNTRAASLQLDSRDLRLLDQIAECAPPLIIDDSSLRTRGPV